MDADCVWTKTPAGVDEIAERRRRIPTRLRTVLILVNGRRSARHLRETAGTLADMGASLAELHGLGLIAPVDAPPHPVARSEPASRASQPIGGSGTGAASAAPPGRRRSLALARFYLLNAMEKSLRTGDAEIREQLRQATTRDALLEAFEVCRNIAAEVGVAHVTSIETEFMSLLPDEDMAHRVLAS